LPDDLLQEASTGRTIKITVFYPSTAFSGRIHHTVPMKNRAEKQKGALEKGAFFRRFTNPY
jgi:hypothetical protein